MCVEPRDVPLEVVGIGCGVDVPAILGAGVGCLAAVGEAELGVIGEVSLLGNDVVVAPTVGAAVGEANSVFVANAAGASACTEGGENSPAGD
ncbi:MAG: hypothetical protein M1343_12525 [Chloroflexi bacterium]|nr:hypothetical protein [Chloroflexota bacterium]MDA8188546.1 hypothetical protein [Dehalococcoidales bacterium]